jgi:hypothetical protein
MKQLPKFIKSYKLNKKGVDCELTIVLHTREKNKPYNRLSHLIVKDWASQYLDRKIDVESFKGPSVVHNKSGSNVGVWTFKIIEDVSEKLDKSTKKKTKKKKTKKTEIKEEKELDKYEEMTYPLPSKD